MEQGDEGGPATGHPGVRTGVHDRGQDRQLRLSAGLCKIDDFWDQIRLDDQRAQFGLVLEQLAGSSPDLGFWLSTRVQARQRCRLRTPAR